MGRIVQKFGGTSVADVARLEMVSLLVKQEVDAGHQVIVVVSAMAGVTNRLVGYAQALAGHIQTAEHDVIAAAGEQVTCGLLALALGQIGLPARSFLAWQIPVLTNNAHGHAHIQAIDCHNLENCLENGFIPVVAGFQGLTREGRLTTLGRGGSDTTAVALASALNADRCDIYTDVKGVYTADPRIVPDARLLKTITYEEMLELSAHGARVLQKSSVEAAMRSRVKLRVLSSFHKEPGTQIGYEDTLNTQTRLAGITHTGDETQIILKNVFDKDHICRDIFKIFSEQDIFIDMIVQTCGMNDQTELTFTILKREIPRAVTILQDKTLFGYDNLILNPNVAKITIVGLPVQHDKGIFDLMVKTLATVNILSHGISFSALKFSMLVDEKQAEEGIRVLHAAFEMDKEL
jgi:aspartate kinase